MRTIRLFLWPLVLGTTLLMSSTTPTSADHTKRARATLRSCADGTTFVGRALLVENPSREALKVVDAFIDVRGLTRGKHAVHIHAVGSCESTTAACSGAGSHLDLGPFPHNAPVTENHPYHSGDLVNVDVGSDGRGSVATVTNRIALTPDREDRPDTRPLSIFDADGASIIIHAMPDAYCPDPTDPNCAGGGRTACGVLRPES
ncbi:MAG TPA: superoxide dismutase family protein [Vicinamibacteria bacterium]|nr:superoxide dismutase family protein [Vicinamibacteria bacterium]